jgi:hypothetical protein
MTKFKPSPFLILFLSLNCILIFCASREVGTEIKISSSLTNTDGNTQLSPVDNLGATANASLTKNTEIIESKVSSDISYIITEKEQSDLYPVVESSVEDSFAKDSDEQQTIDL